MNPLNNIPQQFFNQPGVQQIMQQVQKAANGRSPREIAFQLAQEKGIPLQEFQNLMKQFNLH